MRRLENLGSERLRGKHWEIQGNRGKQRGSTSSKIQLRGAKRNLRPNWVVIQPTYKLIGTQMLLLKGFLVATTMILTHLFLYIIRLKCEHSFKIWTSHLKLQRLKPTNDKGNQNKVRTWQGQQSRIDNAFGEFTTEHCLTSRTSSKRIL